MTQLSLGRRQTIKGRAVGQPPISRPLSMPAPTGGWNAVDALTSMPKTDAISIYNMISRQSGVVTRPGYTNWATNLGNSIDTDVRTVVGFNDISRDKLLLRDKLFACTDQGIYDITSEGTNNPTLMPIYLGFGGTVVDSTGWKVKGGDAGWSQAVNFTNAATLGGKHFLILCDVVNGYHLYDPDGGGAGIGRWYKIILADMNSVVDPTKFSQVCQWKGRLLFTEADSSRMWYLNPGAVIGNQQSTQPVAVDMGTRFPTGGFLKGGYSWTYNGGAGFDDFLVAISSTGDVVVWEGISPADATFQIKGVWYVGEVPRGRRIADEFGGDLFIIGALGVLPLSRLVAGGADESSDKYITHKIQNLVRNFLRDRSRAYGWSITSHPSQGLVIINAPQDPLDQEYKQLVLSQQADAWSVFQDINALHWETWHAQEYAALTDGRVVKLGGDVDTVQTAADTYSETAIGWTLLTAYDSLETPANWKRVHFIRPLFLTAQLPMYSVQAIYDFSLQVPQIIDPPPITSGAKWDIALWDVDIWGGNYVTEQPVIGASGIGRWVAVSLVGQSTKLVSLVGFDLIGEIGGML